MELFEAINQRRSIRSFTQQEVTERELEVLLQAAIRAPSAGNRQPWRFVVVRSPETMEVLYRAASYSTQHQIFVRKAPLIIVVCADLSPYRRLPYRERGETLFVIQDTAAAVQNLLLAATALGLGACWVGLFDEQMVVERLHLPRHVRPVAVVPIGHTKSKAKTRKPLIDLVQLERWGGRDGVPREDA
jgi:nitroreductase